jgi:uncharacterized protein with ParB-like and HNH nuclease domain
LGAKDLLYSFRGPYMSKKIEFTDLAIQKLFQNFYVIPDYQREYVWAEKEVLQLLNDIYEEFSDNPDSEYFLGSIVVCKSSESHKFEVIDGQQRLITLSLVLNNLRRIYKATNENYTSIEKLLFSETITEAGDTINSNIVDILYEGKEVLYDLYKADIDADIDPKMVEGLPGKTIFDAHKHISFFIDGNFKFKDRIPTIKKFLGYFLNKVKLIQIETPEIGNALKIFETINERGLSLDQVDLLKNLLFRQISRKDFQKLKKDWEKFKKSIVGGKEKEKPLRFLRYFIVANYQSSKDKNRDPIVREDDIYHWFVQNEKLCNYKSDSFGFVRKIQENASFYIDLLKNRYNGQSNYNLENIFRLVGSAFKQHFILLLSAKNLKRELFDHFLLQLETLLFYYNITKEPPRDLEKRFAMWAEEIRKVRKKNELNDFIESRMKPDVENRTRNFDSNFLELNANSMQKYKLKYILGKIALYVDNQRIGDTQSISIANYVKRSIHIEHILPENPEKELLNSFSNGDKNLYNEYMLKLGNLTLLERPINTSIKRNFYATKCIEYSKSIFYLTKSLTNLENVGKNTSINRINLELKCFKNWDREAINERHKMLLNLANKIWKIEVLE